jgi:hypothetical protein
MVRALAALAVLGLTASAAQARTVTLAYDAVYAHATVIDNAPAGDSVGDRQVASGSLHAYGGRRVGTFHFVCRYVAIVNGDAREHCTGAGRTADGKIAFSGPARKSDIDHSWALEGLSGALRGARGRGAVHDATANDSIVVITARLARPAHLPDGVVPRSAANRSFIRNATAACAAEHRGLRGLPRFPLDNFDPLNPDPAQLPTVGRFFNGPGDARPLERTLIKRLGKLGRPKVGASIWRGVTRGLPKLSAGQTEQIDAALASDVARFVAAVHAGDRIAAPFSFATRAFGVPGCDLT